MIPLLTNAIFSKSLNKPKVNRQEPDNIKKYSFSILNL